MASDVTGKETAQPGDFSLCVECGNLAAFTDDMLLRPITESDIESMPLDAVTSMQRARNDVSLIIACRKAGGKK